MPASPSERRPSDFLGNALETTIMDPDLMFASASMGSYFPLPDYAYNYNASSTAVHEYEIGTPDEDDPEAERLMLRRTIGREGVRPRGDSLAGESMVAVFGGEGTGLGKRRFSKFGETFVDLGKAVKKRAGSWSWRRDSVVTTPGRALRGRVDESSSAIVSPGSGERSRDGGDEGSGGDEADRGGRRARPWVRGMRRKSAPTGLVLGGNVAPAQRRQTLPAPPPRPMLKTYDSDEQKRLEEEQFRVAGPHRRLMVLERGVRIAEQEGAFDTTAIEKSYKKPHQRLNSECSQQSQASMKLKVKLAREQAKSDKNFRRAQEGGDKESPISKVFNRIWRRNSRGKDVAVQSHPASGLGSSGDDVSSGAAPSVWSEDTIERLRGLSVQAVVHIGRAAQLAAHLAPVPY